MANQNAFPESEQYAAILQGTKDAIESIETSPGFMPRKGLIVGWLTQQITSLNYQTGSSQAAVPTAGNRTAPLVVGSQVLSRPVAPTAPIVLGGSPSSSLAGSSIDQFFTTPTAIQVQEMYYDDMVTLANRAGFIDYPMSENELREYLLAALSADKFNPDAVDLRKDVAAFRSDLLANTEPGLLLDKYPHETVLGLAKMVGMPGVKQTTKVDTKFVGQVKEWIDKQAEIAKAKQSSEAGA